MKIPKWLLQLAPVMASVLKTINEWDIPNIGIDLPPSNMSILTAAVSRHVITTGKQRTFGA